MMNFNDAIGAKFFTPSNIGSAVPKLGMYLDASGSIAFAVGGVKQLAIGSAAGSARLISTGNEAATTTTQGNDTTPVVTEAYVAEVYTAHAKTVNGVAILNGSLVAGNVWVALYDANGVLVGSCAAAGVAQAGAAGYQNIPFTAPVRIPNGSYYAVVAFNNVGARFRSHLLGVFGAGKWTGQVFGTAPVGQTVPTTFTANLGPVASLY